jgi:hypothetical protein
MDAEKPFSSSLVAIWAKDPAQGAMLEGVRIQSLGGRHFIVGEVPDDGSNDTRTGLTYWFAVDDVLMITEFRDMKQARAYYAERNKKTMGH